MFANFNCLRQESSNNQREDVITMWCSLWNVIFWYLKRNVTIKSMISRMLCYIEKFQITNKVIINKDVQILIFRFSTSHREFLWV